MKVVVGASSFAGSSTEALELLKSRGVDVTLNPYGRKLTKTETIDFIKGADGILAGLEVLDEEIFESSPALKAIARIGIGMDNVDIKAAKAYGIKVSNTPDGPTEAVSEMCLTALLAISRGIINSNTTLHSGEWKKSIGFSLHGKTIFFIGYGRIGKAFAELLKPFNMNIIYYDPAETDGSTPFEVGIKGADIITLHSSGKDTVLSKEQFNLMKDGVVILNSARGSLIDEDCLYEELKNGKVAAVWLDVFGIEPYNGKLTECENAILTPHISTYTERCRHDMELQAANNILRDLGC